MKNKTRHIRQQILNRLQERRTRRKNRTRPPRDPREIITPTAFRIQESLLGHPLASPWKRLTALGIDAVSGYLFAGLGTVSIALASGFFAGYIPIRKRRSKGVKIGKARLIVSFCLGLLTTGLILGVSYGAGDLFSENRSDNSATPTSIEVTGPVEASRALSTAPTVVHTDLLRLQAENSTLRKKLAKYKEQSMSLKDRILGLASDFGLSFGWFGLYTIIALTLWNGWTPGKRLLGIRVVHLSGEPMTLWSAFERFGGYAAGTFTGLLGFLQIFWDSNRQGIQDKIGSTVVIDVRKARRRPLDE